MDTAPAGSKADPTQDTGPAVEAGEESGVKAASTLATAEISTPLLKLNEPSSLSLGGPSPETASRSLAPLTEQEQADRQDAWEYIWAQDAEKQAYREALGAGAGDSAAGSPDDSPWEVSVDTLATVVSGEIEVAYDEVVLQSQITEDLTGNAAAYVTRSERIGATDPAEFIVHYTCRRPLRRTRDAGAERGTTAQPWCI